MKETYYEVTVKFCTHKEGDSYPRKEDIYIQRFGHVEMTDLVRLLNPILTTDMPVDQK